ncbi:hypothetical protein PGT21_006853 [Puccinia graminis f. sp. tritici]|uniref:Uncharacterized protein n=1 Tax=Puccinia graminis f. sp. tritici TaxID=56615 RepID=A0A5B0MGS2_PUCGR|nr:hypothetical protein PGT21_006853 [Puccinia graminis f. sp. tritici]
MNIQNDCLDRSKFLFLTFKLEARESNFEQPTSFLRPTPSNTSEPLINFQTTSQIANGNDERKAPTEISDFHRGYEEFLAMGWMVQIIGEDHWKPFEAEIDQYILPCSGPAKFARDSVSSVPPPFSQSGISFNEFNE